MNNSHSQIRASKESFGSQVRRSMQTGPTFESASARLPALRGRAKFGRRLFRLVWLPLILLCLFSADLEAQTNSAQMFPFSVNLGVNNSSQPQDLDMGLKILFTITLLSLAPSIILLMTCFTRIVIVLAFVRTALSLPGSPSNQIIVGLALFMTYFIMAPTWEKIKTEAIDPYTAQEISSEQAMESATVHIRTFMLNQARPKDIELFLGMSGMGRTAPEDLPLRIVIPGFIISELRTAFQMGFLLFVPFILIDLVVATILMSMGMMMMPPMVISLPLKILLFVLVDGWGLIVRSLVQSFGV